MRRTLLAIAAALILPTQASALSCAYPPPPTPQQRATPAGVAEYQGSASVAVVRFHEAPQPPCWWIKFSRWIKPGAYPKDVCEPAGRSQRYRMTVVETLKGSHAASAPAVFKGRHPIESGWLFEHRPELIRKRPNILAAEHDALAPPGGPRRGHSVFSFRHNGRVGDLSVVLDPGLCSDVTAPFIQTFEGRIDYLVFQDKGGVIQHWEMIGSHTGDVLIDRLRLLRAGETDVREKVEAAKFFASLKTVSIYETKWCGEHRRLRPEGGRKEGAIENAATSLWHDQPCQPGQRYLLLGVGPLAERGFNERAWPSIQLVPITDGAIRTADIVTQFKIEGPDTIPVAQALAWTD